MATIKFKGNPLTLAGRKIKPGQPCPDFKVSSFELEDVSLSEFEGRIKIVTSFLSLDTPVCDLQVKEFNKRAAGLSEEAVVLGVSKDLPFAQKRFCQINDIKNALVFSDYKTSSFGINYGLLIKEINLLARAVLILDKNNILRYVQVVEEQTDPPDYEGALRSLSGVVKDPAWRVKQNMGKCVPCEAGSPPLPEDEIGNYMAALTGWQLIEGRKIAKEFKFSDFTDAKYFLDTISVISQEQGHHPVLTLTYNKLKVALTTHNAKGLTKNDFIMAGIIDDLNI